MENETKVFTVSQIVAATNLQSVQVKEILLTMWKHALVNRERRKLGTKHAYYYRLAKGFSYSTYSEFYQNPSVLRTHATAE